MVHCTINKIDNIRYLPFLEYLFRGLLLGLNGSDSGSIIVDSHVAVRIRPERCSPLLVQCPTVGTFCKTIVPLYNWILLA